MRGAVLAIDAGGTKIHIAVANDGKIIADTKIETLSEKGASQCLNRAILKAQEMIHGTGVSIKSIGLASPGVVNPVTKKTEHTWNIPDWDDLDVVGHLRTVFGVSVAIENDANMAAIGESVFDNHGRSFIFFAIGTGFGAGLILQNRLWSGKSGGAGEIARWVMGPEGLRMNLNYGHLEYLMSGSGFETRYFDLTGRTLRGEDIAVLASQGDPIANKIFDDGATFLSIAAANVSTLLDLDTIVLGGGVAMKNPERWVSAIESVTRQVCLYPPKIVVSKLGEQAVLLGAVAEAYRICGEEL